ncbi:MAG TPA: CAP domain-containing protein [Solirubrobacteraceae bacterium]|nr:CAP domain-containing protein [Solirubrobacteraceae bacterium]
MARTDAVGPALAAALILALAPAVATASDCPQGGDLVTALSAPDRATALLCVIDAARTVRAVRAVRPSAQLALAAQGHADDMVARQFFDHVTPGGSTLGDRVNATGYIKGRRDWELGEAIAWAQQPLDTPDTLMRAWLGSPEHRAIILDRRFRDVGIGVTAGLTDGSGGLGATTVLDFGFRTSSPTLPRWRSATSCAHKARTSQHKHVRCASTSTRSKRSS